MCLKFVFNNCNLQQGPPTLGWPRVIELTIILIYFIDFLYYYIFMKLCFLVRNYFRGYFFESPRLKGHHKWPTCLKGWWLPMHYNMPRSFRYNSQGHVTRNVNIFNLNKLFFLINFQAPTRASSSTSFRIFLGSTTSRSGRRPPSKSSSHSPSPEVDLPRWPLTTSFTITLSGWFAIHWLLMKFNVAITLLGWFAFL